MGKIERALPVTVSVPEYGRATFDLSEMSAYAAAERGDFPTIRIGRLKRVPVRAALSKLAGDDAAILKAVTDDFASKFFQLKDDAA